MNFPKFHGIELANGGYIKNFKVEQFQGDPTIAEPGRIWYNDIEDVWKYSEINSISGSLVIKYLDKQQDPTSTILPSGWKSLSVPIIANQSSWLNGPTWAFLTNGSGHYHFADNKNQYINLSFTVPRDHKVGTLVYPVIHWAPASVSTGNTLWEIKYTITKGFGQSEKVDKATTSIRILTAGKGVQYEHLTSISSQIDAFVIPEADCVVSMTISRLGSEALDTLIGEVVLLSTGIIYESDHETTLGKIPNFNIA